MADKFVYKYKKKAELERIKEKKEKLMRFKLK